MKRTLLTILLLSLSLTACGSIAESARNYDLSQSYGSASNSVSSPELYFHETAPSTAVAPSKEIQSDGIVEEEKKIITCSVSMETSSFDSVFEEMQNITEENGGYVQSSEASASNYSSNGKAFKSGYIVLRIPSENYKNVKNLIEGLGNIKNVSESTIDETNNYYDMETRLTRKKIEEERLLEMISNTKNLADLIQLEGRLTEVRTDIEIYESRMNDINRQSAYSTISIYLTEIDEAQEVYVSDDLLSRMKASFITSANVTIKFFENLIVFFAGLIIPLTIIATIVAITLFIKISRKKKNKV